MFNKTLIQILFAYCLLLANTYIYAATVTAANIVTVGDFTRLTIETDQAIKHSLTVLNNPDRVVIDLKNIELNDQLKALTTETPPADPYIKQVRVGKFQQGITRVVVDLMTQAKPKLVALLPEGKYKHRLILDIYPVQGAPMTHDDNHRKSQETHNSDTKTNTTKISESNNTGAKIILKHQDELEPNAESDTLLDRGSEYGQ
jgi:N-acetylmuramoyl-L-alanine amidase